MGACGPNGRQQHPVSVADMFRQFLKRSFQLVGLLLAGILLAMLVGFFVDNEGQALMPPLPWLGWAGFTVLLGVHAVRDNRRNSNHAWFWVTLAGFLAAHTLLYVVLFRVVGDAWRGFWFLPITVAEYMIFQLIVHWLDLDSAEERRPS